jgi:CO/xanthine dehydrogenase FAD-binding subunit
MYAPNFAAPQSIDDAVRMLDADGAKPLSGGTDLIVQMRSGRNRPDHIVDLKRVPGLLGIKAEGAGFRVGAATPGAALGEDKALVAAYPGIVEGAELIGSTQVQGRASLAGNLCNASPAADSVPAMAACGVTAVVVGPNGEREVAVQDIPASPGKTSLAKGEFVKEFVLPALPAKSGDAYLRFIPRTEMDIAVVGAGVQIVLADDGTVAKASVWLGAVAPTIVEVDASCLVGTKLDDAAMAKLDAAAQSVCNPIDDKRGTIEYRTKVAGVMARRTAEIAFKRAGAR